MTTIRSGERVRIEVLDHGRGIAPAALPHVFDRFYRSAEETAGSGAGLGLAIAKEIVRAHGGDVVVEVRLDLPQLERLVGLFGLMIP